MCPRENYLTYDQFLVYTQKILTTKTYLNFARIDQLLCDLKPKVRGKFLDRCLKKKSLQGLKNSL